MNEELNYALKKFKDATAKLEEGVQKAEGELERDGVIQRFEFSFELFWKTVKIFLKDKGINATTPKETLREAFRLEWIVDENQVLNMLEDRNKTTHIYDKATAQEIFDRIRNAYLGIMKDLVEKLETFLGD